MDINEAFILNSVGRQALSDIARQAAGVDGLELQEWRVNQIGGGLGNPVSVGLFRVQGNERVGDDRVAWSVILKVIQSPANVGLSNMGEGVDQTHWNYWKRELLVHQSGLLETLPRSLRAPHCYASMELAGNVACLWFEDLGDDDTSGWSLERYALTARHLGQLNGMYATRPGLAKYPWLGRHRLRQWRDSLTEWQLLDWEHPLVRAEYPADETRGMRLLLRESEDFLVRLERLPVTLCHGDTYPTNFKSRHENGDEQTVALDWALANAGPLGSDLGALVFGAFLNLAPTSLAEIDRELFAGYVAGLRDSGCQVAEQAVRFGYSASAVLLIALFKLMMLYYQIQEGASAADEGDPPIDTRPCFEGTMADIAVALRESV